MKKINPYIIGHIQLEELPGGEALSIAPGQAYFFSCWWRQVPLGQFFIEQEEEFDAQVLEKKIFDAIEPALRWYCAAAGLAPTDFRSMLLQKRYTDFAMLLDTTLAAYAAVVADTVDVSVIICTRNRPDDLQRCLQSLATQTCQPREIIVVDNAPSDNSTRLLVEQYPAIRYYKEPRGGLSIARNAGLRIATSQLVAFTDDDVSLHPLWLYHVAETFRKPGVYAMTGLVLPAALDTESQQLFEKEWSFNNGYCDRSYDSAYFRGSLAKGPKVWEIGAGANMAFRRGVFETAGFFDERLGAGAAGCSEDSEMWYRILAAGLEIRYNPRAVVYHEHRKELTALFRQLFSYMRGHTAAALIQQQQIQEAGYRRYLYRKLTKSYLPLLVKNVFRHPFRYKMLQIQVRGIFSGVLFYMRNRNKPPQTNLT